MSTTNSTFINIDGIIKACGVNTNGQLGLNDTNNRFTFTLLSSITGVKQISCGYGHTILLMNDGTIKSCGRNNAGQLGLNDTINRNVFTVVSNITGVKQISCGNEYTFLLMDDGTIKTCGGNSYGQLGLNDITNRSVFTTLPSIPTDTNVYLIKKKNDDIDLYSIDANNPSLLYTVSPIENVDFNLAFKDLNIITNITQYGKPIDKLDIFKIYNSIKKVIISLFE